MNTFLSYALYLHSFCFQSIKCSSFLSSSNCLCMSMWFYGRSIVIVMYAIKNQLVLIYNSNASVLLCIVTSMFYLFHKCMWSICYIVVLSKFKSFQHDVWEFLKEWNGNYRMNKYHKEWTGKEGEGKEYGVFLLVRLGVYKRRNGLERNI